MQSHFVFSLVDFCLGSTCPEPVYKPLTAWNRASDGSFESCAASNHSCHEFILAMFKEMRGRRKPEVVYFYK